MTKENHIEQIFIAKLQELNHINLGDPAGGDAAGDGHPAGG